VPAFMLSLYFRTAFVRLVVAAKQELHGCYRSGDIAVETVEVVHFGGLQHDTVIHCVPAISRRRDLLCSEITTAPARFTSRSAAM
jgi:hypothetical protein